MKPIFGIKPPTKDSISTRTSTIAKSLATSIIPRIDPMDWEIEIARKILRFDKNGNPLCTYCGGKATELDHLNPLMEDKEPSGYITEIANLVPCCRSCNSKKGSKYWKEWLRNNTEIQLETRKESIAILDKYTTALPPVNIRYSKIPGYKEFWENYGKICDCLIQAEKAAKTILPSVESSIVRHLSPEKRIIQKNNGKYNIFSEDGKRTLLERPVEKVEVVNIYRNADDGGEYISDQFFLLKDKGKLGLFSLDGIYVAPKYDKIDFGDLDYPCCGTIGNKQYFLTPGSKRVEYCMTPPSNAVQVIDRYDYDPSLD